MERQNVINRMRTERLKGGNVVLCRQHDQAISASGQVTRRHTPTKAFLQNQELFFEDAHLEGGALPTRLKAGDRADDSLWSSATDDIEGDEIHSR